MAGGMFAGHAQCAGDLIERDGKKFKLFYGMSSTTAMEKHSGKAAYVLIEFKIDEIILQYTILSQISIFKVA